MTKTKVRTRPIHEACFQNLELLLKGEISFAGWRRRQEELESRLSPAPELPLISGEDGEGPTTKAA
jgi:hypothetical protein